jgi:hypothetical protein
MLATDFKSTVDAVKNVHPQFGSVAWGVVGMVVTVFAEDQPAADRLDY